MKHILFLLLALSLNAGAATKKSNVVKRHPMQIDDCLRWRTIGNIKMSSDGRWVAYDYRYLYEEHPDTLFVFDKKTGKTTLKLDVKNFDFSGKGMYLRYGRQDSVGKMTYYVVDPVSRKELPYIGSDAERIDKEQFAGNNSWTQPEPMDFSHVKGLPDSLQVLSVSRKINGGKQALLYVAPKQNGDAQQRRPMPNMMNQKAEDNGKRKDEVTLELWKWNEPLSPRRRNRVYPRRKVYNKYVMNMADSTLTLIPFEGMTSDYEPGGENVYGFFAMDEHPYDLETDWILQGKQDVYYLSLTGEKRRIITHSNSYPEYSPDARYALYYSPESLSYCLIDMKDGSITDLTKGKIPYPLYDEDHDYPFSAKPYGKLRWEMDRNRVIIYDRFDLWAVYLDGKTAPECITKGYGREHRVRLMPNDKGLSSGDMVYLNGRSEDTMTTGLYVFDGKDVKPLAVLSDASLRLEAYSEDKKTVLWRRSNFSETDYWLSDLNFKKPVRVTEVNAPVDDVLRGTAEIVTWTTYDNREEKGILYLPEGYKKDKPLPMVVTFYELSTPGFDGYKIPEYASATIDVPWFVSNGYAVFEPDIHFKVGAPGESAYNSVVSGVESLIKKGIADEKRVGVNGHSWGGQMTNYLVTRTDIFRCAAPGSAVSNVVSDYLMLRGTGQPNMYFEEDSQGRIGKSLWENPEAYFKESAVLHADKVTTPLLIFQGEVDTSVRADQGLGMFFAMRRLGKPAWLLYYKNEGHQMGGTKNCRDFLIRLSEFFGHYLKDEPLPEWMK